MEKIRQIVVGGSNFVGLYLLFMVPTYILPWLGSNSLIMNFAYLASGGGGLVLLLAHVACLIALCLLAYARGGLVGKPWLVAFPVLAAIFDIVPILSLIPFIPTILHICAMAVGTSGGPGTPEDVFS